MDGLEPMCATCKYHKHDGDVDYMCTCEESDGYGDYTTPDDYCGCWEGR